MPAEITAEMVANVVQIVVAVDSEVAAGDTLLLLESMKMEIPVIAPDGGRVIEILVAEGAAVREGQDLARFEEGVGHVDIFADRGAGRHVGAGEQFPGPGAQDLEHGLVESLQLPALGQARLEQVVDLLVAGDHALDDGIEKGDLGRGILVALDFRTEPVTVELVEQGRLRRAFHGVLI